MGCRTHRSREEGLRRARGYKRAGWRPIAGRLADAQQELSSAEAVLDDRSSLAFVIGVGAQLCN
jgi:hypothetical protein